MSGRSYHKKAPVRFFVSDGRFFCPVYTLRRTEPAIARKSSMILGRSTDSLSAQCRRRKVYSSCGFLPLRGGHFSFARQNRYIFIFQKKIYCLTFSLKSAEGHRFGRAFRYKRRRCACLTSKREFQTGFTAQHKAPKEKKFGTKSRVFSLKKVDDAAAFKAFDMDDADARPILWRFSDKGRLHHPCRDQNEYLYRPVQGTGL